MGVSISYHLFKGINFFGHYFLWDFLYQGCDASVLLDDSNGNKNYSIEKQAIPNQTLKDFDKIDSIKEELEKACPGVVILFLLPLEMALCWSVLDPESLYVFFPFKMFC